MKYFFIAFSLFLFPEAFAQDYVITWNNDTMAVRLPSHPRKEGFRPVYKYDNGYTAVAVVYPNDSVRLVEAGKIKGYYREKHGKQLLCDGDFESLKVPASDNRMAGYDRRDTSSNWFFMRRLAAGRASLYVNYVRWGRRMYDYYYLVLPGSDPLKPVLVRSYKHLLQLLDSPEFSYEKEKKNFRRSWRGWLDMVRAYNRRGR